MSRHARIMPDDVRRLVPVGTRRATLVDIAQVIGKTATSARHWPLGDRLRDHPDMAEGGEFLGWAVVATVATVTLTGPDGAEWRPGTKHFSPGTKVWIAAPEWGHDENLTVVARHRGTSGGLARMVVQRRHLTNFRVRPVYNPTVA